MRYTVPEWAKPLAAKAPSHRVRLAMTPTPIQPMLLPGMPAAFTCSIKRDDMTGSLCSGNKVRAAALPLPCYGYLYVCVYVCLCM